MSSTDTLLELDKEKTISAHEILDLIGNNHLLQRHLFVLGLCNSADAIEITAFGFILNLIRTKDGTLVSNDAFWGGALASSVFFGMLFGGFVCGFLSDRFGRRNMLLYCMSLNFFGAICSSLTLLLPYNFQLHWLLFARLLAGLGVGGTIPSVFALCTEISPKSLSAQSVNFVASFWMIGLLYTALMALILLSNDAAHVNDTNYSNHVQSWPIFAFVAGLPAGFSALFVHIFVKQSPRFLDQKENTLEAAHILRQYLGSKLNEGDTNILSFVPKERPSDEDESLLTETGVSLNNIEMIIEKFAEKKVKSIQESTYTEDASFCLSCQTLFSFELRGSVFRLLICWFSLSFASYGLLSWIATLFTVLGFDKNPYLPSLYFALASFPGNVFALYTSSYLGSGQLLLLSLLLSCACLLLALDVNSKVNVLLGAVGFQCFSTAAWNSLDAISTQRFPTLVRGFAFGTLSSAGRIGGITAGVVNGILFSGANGGLKVLFYNALIIGIGSLSVLTLPKKT